MPIGGSGLDVPGTVRLRSARVPKVASRTERRSVENPVSRAIVLATVPSVPLSNATVNGYTEISERIGLAELIQDKDWDRHAGFGVLQHDATR